MVVELFTSQACSDCPPADALLRRLQALDPGILALDLHVAYFNGPSWTDQVSSKATTDRQYWYASLCGTGEVYPPQAVIDGKAVAVASDQASIVRDISAAQQAATRPLVDVAITPDGDGWRVTLTGQKPDGPATIALFRFDAIDQTAVHGGENRGVNLTEIYVVREIASLGEWDGQVSERRVSSGLGGHLAIIVQGKNGAILGAASK